MQMNLNATQPYPSSTMTPNYNLSLTTLNASVIHPTPTDTFTMTMMIYESTTATGISSSNETNNEEINSFYFYETEQFAVLWILFTMIVMGNSAVLVTLSLSKRKSRMNFFIKQLAVADLSVGLFNVSLDIANRITVSWVAGNLACKISKFIQCMTTFASTYVLVALSIDRYDAITHPMNFSNCWKRAKLLVIGAWTLSALFSIPQFFLFEEALIQNTKQCWIDLGEQINWQIYMSTVSTLVFFIPAIIITMCYAIIVKTIWSKGTYKMPKRDKRTKARRNSDEEDHENSRRASSRGIIPRAKVKTVKMTFVIVIVFILCWSPYIIFDLLQVFEQIPPSQTYIAIASLVQSLAPLNSAANPLIYCLFSNESWKTLRRTKLYRWLIKVFCCRDIPKESSRRMMRGTRTFTTTSSTLTTTLISSQVAPTNSISRPNNNRSVNFDEHTNSIINNKNKR